jgi:RNA polymerase sigma-70 factor (ECF subfamily)
MMSEERRSLPLWESRLWAAKPTTEGRIPERESRGMLVIKTLAIQARGGALNRMDHADWATAAVLHERYLEDVYRYVLRHVSGIEAAEDLTAEVFAAAAAGLSRFRGHCPHYAWLLSIARRKIVDFRRQRTARPERLASELPGTDGEAMALWEALAAVEGPEAVLMRTEARRVVRELLAQLNPDQREVVLLQYVESLPVAEIAVVMGRSLGAVTSLLHRARATLYRRGRAYFLPDDEGHPS